MQKGMYDTDEIYDDSYVSYYLVIPLTVIHRTPDDILNAKDDRRSLIVPPGICKST